MRLAGIAPEYRSHRSAWPLLRSSLVDNAIGEAASAVKRAVANFGCDTAQGKLSVQGTLPLWHCWGGGSALVSRGERVTSTTLLLGNTVVFDCVALVGELELFTRWEMYTDHPQSVRSRWNVVLLMFTGRRLV